MLDAIEKIRAYTISFKSAEEFNEDSKAFDASMMNFIVIGEMAVKISDDLKDKTSSDIDWSVSKHSVIFLLIIILVLMRMKSGRSFTSAFLSLRLNSRR
jgi:hypothetical protein